jgi:MinD superfamily P-loop ATPase
MRVAVSSGKGGTGKTTVAVNLAVVASKTGRRVGYLDCDVEEPNGALFLKPRIQQTRPVHVSVPDVDVAKCNGCGQCGAICQFSAIIAMNNRALVFPELCHGCGGCWLVCPTGAITESHRSTGQLELGRAGKVHCVGGRLDIGEAMSPPVIAAVRDAAPEVDLLIIDSPPGTSCPVIESVRGNDLVLLVTEPTPFGLNDLQLAVEMVRALGLPFAVVINRADVGDDQTKEYCRREDIEVWAEIPDDRRVAEAYSRGDLACDVVAGYGSKIERLLDKIDSRAAVATNNGRPSP